MSEQTFRVAHAAFRRDSDHFQRVLIDFDFFRLGDKRQLFDQVLDREPGKIKSLATGNYGFRHFVDFGGGQDKNDMGGWFFQGLEQGVESAFGKHMYFINDVDFMLERGGRKTDGFPEFADIVHAGMRSGVNFDYVQRLSLTDAFASGAFFASHGALQIFAVDGFGQNAGDGSFAGSARAGKKIGLPDTIMCNRVGKGFHDMFLADHLGKIFRPIFSVKSLRHIILEYLLSTPLNLFIHFVHKPRF